MPFKFCKKTLRAFSGDPDLQEVNVQMFEKAGCTRDQSLLFLNGRAGGPRIIAERSGDQTIPEEIAPDQFQGKKRMVIARAVYREGKVGISVGIRKQAIPRVLLEKCVGFGWEILPVADLFTRQQMG